MTTNRRVAVARTVRAFPRLRHGLAIHAGARPVAAVALAAALLRLPTLIEPHHYGDEGIFAAMGQRVLQGHALYAGAWDDKPPLIYWSYAGVLAVAGPSMAALRALALVWVAAGAAGVAVLGRRLFGPRAGTAAGLLFALLSSLPLVEANLALTELFAATPVIWAMAVVAGVPAARHRGRQAAVAGALFAVGALFKQVAVLDACAAGLFLLLAGRLTRRSLPALAAGAALPLALAAAVLAAQDALGEALYAVAGFYTVYLREGSGLPPAYAALKLLPAAVALSGRVRAARCRTLSAHDLPVLWLGFAATGAAMAGRPFGHYLVQVLAPASLLVVMLALHLSARPRVRGAVLTAVAAAVTLAGAFSGFWLSFPMVRPQYYSNLAAYVTGRQSRRSFEQFFSWRIANQQRLAELIRADADRTLYVWGEYPWLYPLADAENPTRYTTSYHTSFVPGAKAEVLEALRRAPPRYIVWEREEWRRLPGLSALLAAQYDLMAVVDNTELYRRKDPVP